MSHEENKKHSLEDLRNQSIEGSSVLGGGSNDLGITEDFSGASGMVSEGAIMDSLPLDQDPMGGGNPIINDTTPFNNPTNGSGGGPSLMGPGMQPAELK